MSTITCPFCFEQFNAHKVHFRCINRDCLGRVPDETYAKFRGKMAEPMGRPLFGHKPLFAPGISCDSCHELSTTRLCPHCHFQLPDNIEQIDQRVIAIIGGRATGKTHYIASLITRLENEVGKNFSIAVRKADDDTRQRWNNDFYIPLFVHKTVLQPTLPMNLDSQIQSPLIFRLTIGDGHRRRTFHLSFFDSAGEDMNSLGTMSLSQYRYISYADGIIFLLDPLQIPRLRQKLSAPNLPAIDPDASPEYIIGRLRSLFEKRQSLRPHQKIKIPIAFTLSKIDTLLPILSPGSLLQKPSMHYGDVDLQNIQSASTEISNYLKSWLSPNFLQVIQDDFAVYKYFGISSLGESPGTDNHLSMVSPLRVEDPLLWLFYKMDILRGK